LNTMGMAVLMATHDLELVRGYPDVRLLELSDGRLVYDSASVMSGEGEARTPPERPPADPPRRNPELDPEGRSLTRDPFPTGEG